MKVGINIPTYDGSINFKTMSAVMMAAKTTRFSTSFFQSSLLAYSFNMMWARTLNERESQGVTHFLLLHADIVPENFFLDKMMSIMQSKQADVLSVVSPIKNMTGLTSTAIESEDPWKPHRLTLREIYDPAMDETFTHPKLLVNSGCLLVDIRKPWVNHVKFSIQDLVRKNENGLFEATAFSEDWYFSREARFHQARIFATREVKIQHIGQMEFGNDHGWGKWDKDERNGKAQL